MERSVDAATEAVKNLRPARVRLATARSPELDLFIDDDRPPKRHDWDVIAIEAVDQAGKSIATLVNWANHPEALGSRNTEVSADYVGYLRTHHEKARGGGTVVFANGALGGMQSPLGSKLPGYSDRTWDKADYIGRRVADVTSKALDQAKLTDLDQVEFRENIIRIPLSNPGFQEAARAPLLECARVPGELYPEFSLGGVERYSGADFPDAPIETPIKPLMKAPHRMLFGLANDENGYIIPAAEWDNREPWLNRAKKRWYGEVNSIGVESAPLIARTLGELLLGR